MDGARTDLALEAHDAAVGARAVAGNRRGLELARDGRGELFGDEIAEVDCRIGNHLVAGLRADRQLGSDQLHLVERGIAGADLGALAGPVGSDAGNPLGEQDSVGAHRHLLHPARPDGVHVDQADEVGHHDVGDEGTAGGVGRLAHGPHLDAVIGTPLACVGIPGVLGLDPLAHGEGLRGILVGTELAAVGDGLDAGSLRLGGIDGRGAAVDHRPEALGLLGDGVLKAELLGEVAGPGGERLQLEVAGSDGVGVGTLHGANGVHPVGDFGRLVGELLDHVHGLRLLGQQGVAAVRQTQTRTALHAP